MSRWQKEEIRINESQNEEFFQFCGNCVSETRHVVLTSVFLDASDEESYIIDDDPFSETSMWFNCDYQTVKCRGCDSISFRQASRFSEDQEFDPVLETLVPFERIERFPKYILNSRGIEDDRKLPRVVKTVYFETCSALANKHLILGGMGLRALLESICRERGISGAKLAHRINGLVTVGLLTSKSAELLHILREMGNESAHECRIHPETELMAALQILEHLLTDVYIIPEKAKSLSKVRPATEIDGEM